LVTGEELALQRGPVWLNARASASIPGIFPPARVDGRWLVDGGVASPIPCRVIRASGADIVLGVSLEVETAPQEGAGTDLPSGFGPRGPTWPLALYRAFDWQQQWVTRPCLQQADVPIRAFTPPVS